MSFGINRNGSVLAWLGDIKNIPLKEQFYWLVENIAPEHNAESEFYNAQINVEFTDPPKIVRCLNSLSRLNSKFYNRYRVHLYKERSIEERIQDTARYKRLINNSADDFKVFISELNEIINENTNNAEIRKLLSTTGAPINTGLKGNKLLEIVYTTLLNDKDNSISPFFILYDLRLWADHSGCSDKFADCLSILGLSDSKNYSMIMEAIAEKIIHSCNTIESLIASP